MMNYIMTLKKPIIDACIKSAKRNGWSDAMGILRSTLFIEAFQELGRVIYQDTGELRCPPDKATQLLRSGLCNAGNHAAGGAGIEPGHRHAGLLRLHGPEKT